ncbi:hypothetical protein ACHAWF_011787 [Thalassiosira exigua]
MNRKHNPLALHGKKTKSIMAVSFLGTVGGFVLSTVVLSLAGILFFLKQGFDTTTSPTRAGIRTNHNFNRASNYSSQWNPNPYSAINCTADVYVTLHEKGGGDSDSKRECKGLLIRDDIIVTSRACSKGSFTFHFASYGAVSANPHISLNSKEEMTRSRLGFLEAHPPYHTIYSRLLVRRTRMFLSKRHMPSGNENGAEDAVFTCGSRMEPIAHSFPVDGEMVPLAQLSSVVPDDILWDEEDITTAVMLKYKHHLWWTKPVTLEEEESMLERMLQDYTGPPGSINIFDVESHRVDKIIDLFEAEDPKGHRHRDCFRNYFVRYRKETPFSGMHFFDWLDFGNGKFLLEKNAKTKALPRMKRDKICHKRDWHESKIHYFAEEERLKHAIYISPSEDVRKLFVRCVIVINILTIALLVRGLN